MGNNTKALKDYIAATEEFLREYNDSIYPTDDLAELERLLDELYELIIVLNEIFID